LTYYARKDLDDIARDILRTRRNEQPPGMLKNAAKLHGWTLIINGHHVSMAVLIDDPTGRRQINVAI
jgi:hypothetical protein